MLRVRQLVPTLAAWGTCAVALAGCPERSAADAEGAVTLIERERRPRAKAGNASSSSSAAAGQAYTNTVQFKILKRQCASELRRTGGGDGAGLVSGYGVVYRGNGAIPGDHATPADGVFRTCVGDVEEYDPSFASDNIGSKIVVQMFETLLTPAAGNSNPLPGAAESFEVSADGLRYTFRLREGLVWSDGRPVTAEDFRFAMLRALDPANASKAAQQVWAYVKGARAFNSGAVKDASEVGIQAVDARTLVIELVAPTPYFNHVVTYTAYAPLPRHVVAEHGKRWLEPAHIVVNGPYTLAEYKPRQRFLFRKNPRYWDRDGVAVEEVEFQILNDEEEIVRRYEDGRLHVAGPVPPETRKLYIKQNRGDLRLDQAMCTYLYWINGATEPFNDPFVRRALNMAVDKQRLIRDVLEGFEKPATGMVPDMFQQTIGYVPQPGDAFDPDRARRLLADAGFPGGRGFPPVQLLINESETHRTVAQFVQESVQTVLGVEIRVEERAWKDVLQAVDVGDFQMARVSWCADYPSPMAFVSVLDSEGDSNYASYQNPAYDRVLGDLERSTDRQQRNVLFCAAERALNRDMPFLPLFFYTQPYLIRPFVKGFEPQYQDVHAIRYVRFDPPPPGAEVEEAAPADLGPDGDEAGEPGSMPGDISPQQPAPSGSVVP